MGSDRSDREKTLEKIAQAYSSPPWWYDVRGFFILTFAYRSTLGAQIRLFGENMGPYHLEVAVGSGTLTDIVLRWRKWKGLPPVRVAGIDYAESMLAGAIRRFAKRPGIELHLADVASLPFTDGSFDSANVANAVHCFPDVDAGLREVFRVLRPDGRLAANVLLHPRGPRLLRRIAAGINRWGMRKGILITPYEKDDIRARIAAAGFEVLLERVSGNTYNVIARKPPR